MKEYERITKKIKEKNVPAYIIEILNSEASVKDEAELKQLLENDKRLKLFADDYMALNNIFPEYSTSIGRRNGSGNISIFISEIDRQKNISCAMMIDEKNAIKTVFERFIQFSGEHSHDCFELTFILEGEAEIMINGVKHIYKKGDACLINSSVRHSEDFSKNCTAVYISIGENFLAGFSGSTIAPEKGKTQRLFLEHSLKDGEMQGYIDYIYQRSNAAESKAQKCIYSILEEFIDKKAGSHYVIMGMMSRLFFYLEDPEEYQLQFLQYRSDKEKKIVDGAIAYIEKKRAKVTRSELAEALHYNGDYIDQIFRKYNFVSIHEFSVGICIREAQKLLRTSDMSVGDIIKKVGYENRSSFYALFEKKCGMTPAQYRRSIRKDNQ